MSSENIELVRRTFETFNAGVSTLPDFWAEDAEVWPAPGFPERGPFRGREQIQRFFDGLLEGWEPETTVVAREFEEAGDKVLVSFEWRATGEGLSDVLCVVRGDRLGLTRRVARRLHRGRDLGEPFDFLTWFEFAPESADAFEELVERLRETEEWAYVEREIDIRLIRD